MKNYKKMLPVFLAAAMTFQSMTPILAAADEIIRDEEADGDYEDELWEDEVTLDDAEIDWDNIDWDSVEWDGEDWEDEDWDDEDWEDEDWDDEDWEDEDWDEGDWDEVDLDDLEYEMEVEALVHIVFPDRIDVYTLDATDELTVELFLESLTELTGYSFAGTYEITPEGVIFAWDEKTPFLSGEKTEPKEGFEIEDPKELAWFMMDSLADTLEENMGFFNIWYTDHQGEALPLPGTEEKLPEQYPYLRASFYQNQEEPWDLTKADQMRAVLEAYLESELKDGWKLTEVTDVEEIEIDGEKAGIFYLILEEDESVQFPLAVTEKGIVYMEDEETGEFYVPGMVEEEPIS